MRANIRYQEWKLGRIDFNSICANEKKSRSPGFFTLILHFCVKKAIKVYCSDIIVRKNADNWSTNRGEKSIVYGHREAHKRHSRWIDIDAYITKIFTIFPPSACAQIFTASKGCITFVRFDRTKNQRSAGAKKLTKSKGQTNVVACACVCVSMSDVCMREQPTKLVVGNKVIFTWYTNLTHILYFNTGYITVLLTSWMRERKSIFLINDLDMMYKFEQSKDCLIFGWYKLFEKILNNMIGRYCYCLPSNTLIKFGLW